MSYTQDMESVATPPTDWINLLYRTYGKRFLDVAFAAMCLPLLAPLFGLTSLIIYLEGGPVLFVHWRVGVAGVGFPCLKFRTMVPNAEAALEAHLTQDKAAREEWQSTRKLTKDPRVTRFGQFLRKSSIDELPQLVNILLGQMSFVGPRPITKEEMATYGEAAAQVTSVLPGLTGLWQVQGRNDLTMAQRKALDLEYVRRMSVGQDLRIMLRTAWHLLRMGGQ